MKKFFKLILIYIVPIIIYGLEKLWLKIHLKYYIVFKIVCLIAMFIIDGYIIYTIWHFWAAIAWIIAALLIMFASDVYLKLDASMRGCIWYFMLVNINVFLVYISCNRGLLSLKKIYIENDFSNELMVASFLCMGFLVFGIICLSVCIIKFVLLLNNFFIKQHIKQSITAVAIVVTLVTYIISGLFKLSLKNIDNLKQK